MNKIRKRQTSLFKHVVKREGCLLHVTHLKKCQVYTWRILNFKSVLTDCQESGIYDISKSVTPMV